MLMSQYSGYLNSCSLFFLLLLSLSLGLPAAVRTHHLLLLLSPTSGLSFELSANQGGLQAGFCTHDEQSVFGASMHRRSHT